MLLYYQRTSTLFCPAKELGKKDLWTPTLQNVTLDSRLTSVWSQNEVLISCLDYSLAGHSRLESIFTSSTLRNQIYRYGVVAKNWRVVTTVHNSWNCVWMRKMLEKIWTQTALYNKDVFGVKVISCKWRCVAVTAVTHQCLFYPVVFLGAVLWCGVCSVNCGYWDQLMHNKSDYKIIVALNFAPRWLLGVGFLYSNETLE